jgi:hypothetical protein
VAISAAFVAAQLLPWLGWNPAAGERWACFGSWALCVLWTARRAPLRAAQELLWLAAGVTALVPVAHGWVSGWWFWRSAVDGQWGLFAIDVGALALAVGFAAVARAAAARGRHGKANSVWAIARA